MSLWTGGLWDAGLWADGLWDVGAAQPSPPRVSGGGGFTMRDMDPRFLEPEVVSRRRENDEALLIHIGAA